MSKWPKIVFLHIVRLHRNGSSMSNGQMTFMWCDLWSVLYANSFRKWINWTNECDCRRVLVLHPYAQMHTRDNISISILRTSNYTESESICIKLSLDILRCLCAINKQIWWRTDRHGTCDCTDKSLCIGNHVGIACIEPSELTEDDVVSSLSRASFESKWNGWINDIKLLTESIVFGAMCNGRIWLTNEYDGCYCHVSEWVSTNGNDGSVYDTNELWCAHFRVALIFISFFVAGVSLVRLPVCDWQTDQTGRRWRRRERGICWI